MNKPKNESKNFFRRHLALSIILIILAIPILFLLVMAIMPINSSTLTSNPNPAKNYDDAMAKFDEFSKEESSNQDLGDDCRSQLLDYGKETDIVYVFYHGLTSCPAQFSELGKDFHDRGYNVFIPRLPGHGYADRDVKHLEDLKAEDLTAFADQTTDIAEGLGKKVVVVGLSGGGTIASWIAQNRSDVSEAVLLNPFFGVAQIPAPLTKTAANFGITVPNMNFYSKKAYQSSSSVPTSPGYGYEGLSTQGESQFLRLALAVGNQADKGAPNVKNYALIILQNDPVVNDKETKIFIEKWLKYPDIALCNFMINESRGLPHDMITPSSNKEDMDYVYSLIMKIIPRTCEKNNESG